MSNIDGTYTLTHVTSRKNADDVRGMDEIEITNGQSHYTDAYGCKWDTNYEAIDNDHIKMTASADQSSADLDHVLAGESGKASAEIITYETTLKISTKGDDRIMSGQINIGDDLVIITLHKINPS